MTVKPVDLAEVERTRDRRRRMVRELAEEMSDAIDFLGSMSTDVEANGRSYRITIEEVRDR